MSETIVLWCVLGWFFAGICMGWGNGYRGQRQTLGEHFANGLIMPLIFIFALPFFILKIIGVWKP